MTQETVTYLTNIGITVVLAGMLTHSWSSQGRSVPMRFWMMAAWVMVLTNCLFAARPMLPFWVGRLFPTLLVTVAHVGILFGARATAGRSLMWRVGIGVIVAHGVVLLFFILLGQPTYWRMVCNGLVWASLSVAAFVVFRQGPAYFWKSIFSPANVLLLHAVFHLCRITLSILSGTYNWTGVAGGLQLIGDLEVSMFIVALYVSILVATLRQHYEELARARVEMQTLSGLLPICAWCKKVRDDGGYWQQVEEYFSKRSHVDFTHGICADCARDQLNDFASAQTPDKPT